MLKTYGIWDSDPNVPNRAGKWLSDVGFSSVRITINLHSPTTIGQIRFNHVVLATAASLQYNHPEVWGEPFLEKLDSWAKSRQSDPFISIATSWVIGNRASDPFLLHSHNMAMRRENTHIGQTWSWDPSPGGQRMVGGPKSVDSSTRKSPCDYSA